METLGIDVGGSAIKVARWDGERLEVLARVAHRARGVEAVTSAVAAAVSRAVRGTLPCGLAVAGLVRDGVVERSGNLELVEAPLREAIERALGRELAAFVSDARALGEAALGEAAPGEVPPGDVARSEAVRGEAVRGEAVRGEAVRGELGESVRVALGLGTGVGGALVADGRIVRDRGLGHGTLLDEVARAPCAIGHRSCLEAFLGAAALVREAREAGLDARTPAELDALPRGQAILERAGERLARGVAGLVSGSALLVLSGGVARSCALVESARRELAPRGVRVVLSRFGADAAVAGAALAALRS